jgi:hypothetical protein
MALIQKNGMLHYIDDSGNVYVLYPITTLENVAGTGKLLLSEDGKTIKTLDGTAINPTLPTPAEIGAAPAHTWGTEDIEAGSPSNEPTGTIHLVIE